jgi:hypothetical protein
VHSVQPADGAIAQNALLVDQGIQPSPRVASRRKSASRAYPSKSHGRRGGSGLIPIA